MSGLKKELLLSLPKAQPIHSSSRTGLTISVMLFSTTNFSLSLCSMLIAWCLLDKLNSSVQSSLCPAMFISSIMAGQRTVRGCRYTAPTECSCSSINFTFSNLYGGQSRQSDMVQRYNIQRPSQIYQISLGKP